jgi:hypothetical protein
MTLTETPQKTKELISEEGWQNNQSVQDDYY